jgi:hypothetical protein
VVLLVERGSPAICRGMTAHGAPRRLPCVPAKVSNLTESGRLCRAAGTAQFCPRPWKNAIGGGRRAVFGAHGGRGAGKSAGACGLSEAIRF